MSPFLIKHKIFKIFCKIFIKIFNSFGSPGTGGAGGRSGNLGKGRGGNVGRRVVKFGAGGITGIEGSLKDKVGISGNLKAGKGGKIKGSGLKSNSGHSISTPPLMFEKSTIRSGHFGKGTTGISGIAANNLNINSSKEKSLLELLLVISELYFEFVQKC